MELTASFIDLLQHFVPVFTTPTFQTFLQVVTGWVVSHRHRYLTEVIFAGGNVGNGHWCRFHRFFSHAAWDLDTFALFLAKLVVTILAAGATLFWAVDDTLCRKRGLTLYGAGMHYDPLISSRAKSLVSWGHDWVVLCLIIVKPFWAPTKVFALPIAVRLYRNRQGLTKGKKGRGKASKPDPNHRTRPQLALELIQLVAQWYPDDEIILTGVSACSYQPRAGRKTVRGAAGRPVTPGALGGRPPGQTAEPFPTAVSVVFTPSARQSRGAAGELPSGGPLYAATRRDGVGEYARGGSRPSGPAARAPDPSLPRSSAAARPADRPTVPGDDASLPPRS